MKINQYTKYIFKTRIISDMKQIKITFESLRNNGSLLIKILFSLFISIVLYWKDIVLLGNEVVNNDFLSHIVAVPFLLIYSLYRIRKTFIASVIYGSFDNNRVHFHRDEYVGGLLCLFAILMKLYGSYTFLTLEIHLLSLPIFVAGVILLIFNASVLRVLIFPVFFLFMLVPPPLKFLHLVGSMLSILSSQFAYRFLKILGLPIELNLTYGSPIIMLNMVSGEVFPFTIDISCSGLYSLIGFLLFAVFAAYIVREPILKKIIIVILGFPIIYLLNIIRIIIIIVVGYISGPNLAMNLFHLIGGWVLIFSGTILLFILLEKVFNISIYRRSDNNCLHKNNSNDGKYCLDCGMLFSVKGKSLSKNEILKYILISLIFLPLVFIKVPLFTLSEGDPEVLMFGSAGNYSVAGVLPIIEGFTASFFDRDYEFEEISGQDASLWYIYEPDQPDYPIIWVGIEIGPTKGCLHPWEMCYLTWPLEQGWIPKVNQLDLRDVHLNDNPPVTARYFSFIKKDVNEGQVILYWYTKSVFQYNGDYDEKWVKISLIEMLNDRDDYHVAEERLLPIAIELVNHWKPLSEWSWVSLIIAENSNVLFLLFTGAILILIVINEYFNTKKYERAKFLFNKISSLEDIQVLESVMSLQKKDATDNKIALKYRELTKKDIDLDILRAKLLEAETSGLIRRRIVNIKDEPYLTWRVLF